MTTYADFLAAKAISHAPAGFAAELHPALFPFQRKLTATALERGRSAIFAGTGLGKTLMQLAWADAVRHHTDAPVLILTPLAVAQQTVREAARFGISGVAYAADASVVGPITVTNYDRFDRFDIGSFGAIGLDESSILKSHDGATRKALTEACARTPFRLCCSATPAPNDYTELGQHSEFLGILSAKEMLATWFVHDGSVRATNVANHGGKPVADWRLKRHAERDFWRWVSTWATMARKPSDLGFPDDGYDLPPLNRKQVTVPVDYTDDERLFPLEAHTLSERLQARRTSIDARVRAAADIVNAQPDRPWLVWCHLNAEEEALCAAIPGAVAVRGTDSADLKTLRLIGFCDGAPRVLISKPSICGHGMNWQHCADMVFVGLNDSFEQVYQAIRRCWRFGQTRPVNVYMIASELEGAVVANILAKEAAFDAMGAALAAQLRVAA